MKLSEATILVVDDEPDLLDIFQHWLKDAGCATVYTAVDGGDAIDVARRAGSLDLLVTDINMPVMDGISLVRNLNESGLAISSVIFVSGFGDIGEREMYALGVEAFLSKPLQRKDFIATIESALLRLSHRWLTPMSVAPQQIMRIDVPDPEEVEGRQFVHLGRGGFTARFDGSLTLGKVAFDCSVPAQQTRMAGEGYVRWRSRTDQTFGVEFAYLDPSCRDWVLQAIAIAAPRSFIPRS